MDNNCASQDAVLARQRDLFVADVDLGASRVVGDDVSQVASVSDLVRWSTVFLAVRVEMWSGTHAAIGVISKFVDVEAMQAGFQSGDFTRNLDGIRLGLKRSQSVSKKLCKSSTLD